MTSTDRTRVVLGEALALYLDALHTVPMSSGQGVGGGCNWPVYYRLRAGALSNKKIKNQYKAIQMTPSASRLYERTLGPAGCGHPTLAFEGPSRQLYSQFCLAVRMVGTVCGLEGLRSGRSSIEHLRQKCD